MPPWCESILSLKVEAVQGKKFSLEWTETSRGLCEWGVILLLQLGRKAHVHAPTRDKA